MGRPRMDITGQRFGKLTAIRSTGLNPGIHGTLWECKCECGGSALATVSDLRRGKRKSCGCLHGAPRKEVLHEPAEDCFAFDPENPNSCKCLNEMLCRTTGKCVFYDKGGVKC